MIDEPDKCWARQVLGKEDKVGLAQSFMNDFPIVEKWERGLGVSFIVPLQITRELLLPLKHLNSP